VRIDFAGIRQRLTVLPTGVDARSATVSPDGRQLLIVGEAAGQPNLWTWSLDELAREAPVARQLTSTGGPKSDAQWGADAREVYYSEAGRLAAVSTETRAVRQIPVQAELDVDFAVEKGEVFAQAWGYLREHFYDEAFHGADWDAVRARTAPQVAGARTPDELRRVLALMVGELNASHLGVNAPGGQAPSTGRLGVRLDPAAYARDGVLRVREVVPSARPRSPACAPVTRSSPSRDAPSAPTTTSTRASPTPSAGVWPSPWRAPAARAARWPCARCRSPRRSGCSTAAGWSRAARTWTR
jgi:hypothetical protein